MSLKNKVVIITGAARGIGRSVALELARLKSKLVLVDIDLKELKEVNIQVKNKGGEVISIKGDVTKEKEVKKIIRKTKKEFGNIDVLINNAASLLQKPIEEIQEKEWNSIIQTKINGIYNFVKNTAEDMKSERNGKIINLASIAGIVGLKNSSAHAAVNGGIINLTRQLATELSPYKINVNTVSPGVIATSMTEDLLSNKEIKEELISNIPLGRIGTPEEVADAVIFLASKDSDFITGHNLVVDGGWLTH